MEDTLPWYIPHERNQEDPDRENQVIWNLVGLNGFLLVLKNVFEEFSAWARTDEELEIAFSLNDAIATYERGCYDRFARKGYRPSVEYSLIEG